MAYSKFICQTTASLSAPPAADSYDLPAYKHVCYNGDVPLHVCKIGLHIIIIIILLLQDSDYGTASQQNSDNLTSPSDNSVRR